jgi:hypothetical protein
LFRSFAIRCGPMGGDGLANPLTAR